MSLSTSKSEKPDWIDEADWLDTQSLMKFTSLWLTKLYGERCSEHDPDCECCRRWFAFDKLFGDL